MRARTTLATLSALLAVFLAVFALAASASAATAGSEGGSEGGDAAARQGRTSLRIVTKSQRKIVRGKLIVKVNSTRKKVKLRARSSTFDSPRLEPLARPVRVKMRGKRKRTVKIRLSRSVRNALQSCEVRELQVSARKSKITAPMIRDTPTCAAKAVDLSSADRCDFIGTQDGSLCMLPFPDDFYTTIDSSTRTGRRVAFRSDSLPANEAGTHIDAGPYNGNDGFSPGQTIVVRVPGLDDPAALARTAPVSLDRLARKYRSDQKPGKD